MRKPLIAGNFKMFKTVAETVSYVNDLRALIKDVANVDIAIAPPFTSLASASEAAKGSAIDNRRAEPALGARRRVHR